MPDAELLIERLQAEPPDSDLEQHGWELAVACHGRMLALEHGHRLAAIHHAVAGAQLIAVLRQRGAALPEWLAIHEEQLCRYGGLWIHDWVLGSDLDPQASDAAGLIRHGVVLLDRLNQIHEGRHAWIGLHLRALQRQAAGPPAGHPAAPGLGPTIAVAGNCQFWPLYLYLGQVLPNACLHAGPTVHLATPEQVEAFHRLLPSVDTLLIHRIQPGYRNDIGLDNQTLGQQLSDGAQQLVLPSVHYEGHHPWIGYVHDPEGRLAEIESSSPLGAYHDFLAMQAAIHDVSAADILARPLHADLAGEIREHHQASLEQLRQREADCQVEISSWIEQHHRMVPIVHTINHPTPTTLRALLLRVLGALDLSTEVDPTGLDLQDHLGGLSIPLLPWVREALELEEWAERSGHRHGQEPFAIQAQLEDSIAFYRRHPWIAEQNRHQEKFRWAARVLASPTG